MSWRILVIEEGVSLKLSQNQVIGLKDGIEYSMPIEDLMLVLVDNGVLLTSDIISELGNFGVSLLFCDRRKMPCSLLLSLSDHSRNSEIAHTQVAIAEPLRKRLWQQIIKKKIFLQAECLDYFEFTQVSKQLHELATQVSLGDQTNHEAQAAKLYFGTIFGDKFVREYHYDSQQDHINMYLNYGYAVIRARVASSLVSVGLLTQFGIFHRNSLNPFNLADDIMEVYRPFVDFFVKNCEEKNLIDTRGEFLSKENRSSILQILNQQILINKERRTLAHCIQVTAHSLVKSMRFNEYKNLLLPDGIV